jgi:hypothetical protein
MIDNSSLQVPSCNIRSFTQFPLGHNNCPQLDAVNLVYSDIDIDILGNQIRSLSHNLQQ